MGLVDLTGYTYDPIKKQYVKSGSADQSVNWMNLNASNQAPYTQDQLSVMNQNAKIGSPIASANPLGGMAYDPSKVGRYNLVDGQYVADPNGGYQYQQGMGGSGGYLSLGTNTPLGYPTNPTTGKTYVSEGVPTVGGVSQASLGNPQGGSAGQYASMWNNIKNLPYTGQNPQSAAWGSVSSGGNNIPYSNQQATGYPQPQSTYFGQPIGSQGGFGNTMYNNPYGQAGSYGQNGFSNFANQTINPYSVMQSPMGSMLSQYTGYYPTDYFNQSGDQSLNVLQLNSMLNPQSGYGIQNNYGGAGGGLPDYFGNGWGMGVNEYTQQFNQADLQGSLGDLSQYGGIGGNIAERLNKLYNPYGNRGIGDMTADYLEYAAPRYAQGWNLYGMSPALEGMLAQQNPSPHNYNANWAGQGQQGVRPFTLPNMIANAYPRTSGEWEDGGWRDFYPPPTNYAPLDSMVMTG